MAKLIKKRSKKTGLPPGTLVHIGEKKGEKTEITLVEYDERSFKEEKIHTVGECFQFKKAPAVTWVNVAGIHQVEVFEKIGNCFGLHPLVMEDILNTDQRPKKEDYGEVIYIVLKILSYDEQMGEIAAEQISLVLGANFLLSFQEKEGEIFSPIREGIKNEKSRVRKMGADYLAYTLLDIIVDHYFNILEK
ncbi:MAG: magnesium and cobalt transport protein CorA, partial [Deltaproteobacteria bacterium]|nr:magnesium and cobalt transport protein CorA [Deltaproteobacteria bacterium]